MPTQSSYNSDLFYIMIPFLCHFHLTVNKTKSAVLLTVPKHLVPTETEQTKLVSGR